MAVRTLHGTSSGAGRQCRSLQWNTHTHTRARAHADTHPAQQQPKDLGVKRKEAVILRQSPYPTIMLSKQSIAKPLQVSLSGNGDFSAPWAEHPEQVEPSYNPLTTK